ncbi:MAG: sulfite reductase subunit C [Spirochaetes bacterium]|nr:sulfite reductase subunit C [Spirochaetota bacterium]
MDLNTKKVKKNAYRITKVRGKSALRIRIPGGHLPAEHLRTIQHIADTFGNGTVHLTVRQGFEVPGIPYEKMPEVNKLIQPIIEGLGINHGNPGDGYPSAGTRNISACIGERVCPFACYDTTAFAKRIEKAVYPHDFHFKIALTGCPNDCAKIRLHDFGIIGMTHPQFEAERCVNCKACIKFCKKKSVEALTEGNWQPDKNDEKCIGCGECVLNCPTSAWTRSREKYYRLTIMGRTGKRNPRLSEDFIKWVDEDSIIKIICNTYKYVDKFLDRGAPGGKEHIGYIVDRTGFEEYKKWAMEGVTLGPLAELKHTVYWGGKWY